MHYIGLIVRGQVRRPWGRGTMDWPETVRRYHAPISSHDCHRAALCHVAALPLSAEPATVFVTVFFIYSRLFCVVLNASSNNTTALRYLMSAKNSLITDWMCILHMIFSTFISWATIVVVWQQKTNCSLSNVRSRNTSCNRRQKVADS